jgi:glutamine amidotransferase
VRVTILDYGAGNLHSLAKAVATAGAEARLETDPVAAAGADVLILPGVGAFPRAAASLASGQPGLRAALEGGLPCLGICLGMQLLFDTSEEGPGAGLGLLRGGVTRLEARRLPQIGWNTIEPEGRVDPLLAASRLDTAYFANGFACRPADTCTIRAWSRHETDRFPVMVRHKRTVGVQFHPEKSSTPGVAFVTAFLQEAAT